MSLGKICLFTSLTTYIGWICYAEKTHGNFILPFISSTKSPQQIMGSLVKDLLAKKLGKQWVQSIWPGARPICHNVLIGWLLRCASLILELIPISCNDQNLGMGRWHYHGIMILCLLHMQSDLTTFTMWPSCPATIRSSRLQEVIFTTMSTERETWTVF